MAVEAVVSVVIQKLTDMKSVTFYKVIDHEVENIKKALEGIQGFLVDAVDKQEGDRTVKEWAGQYLRILYDVEDVIESTIALGIARQRRSRMGFFLTNFSLLYNNLNARQKLRRKMKQIKLLDSKKPHGVQDASRKVIAPSFQDNRSQHNQQSFSSTHSEGKDDAEVVSQEDQEIGESDSAIVDSDSKSSSMTESSSTTNALQTLIPESLFQKRLKQNKLASCYSYDERISGIFDIKKDVNSLVEQLIEKDNPGGRFVSIVGKVGSGKTTIALAIYKSRDIKQRFECRAWVFFSTEYTMRDLLLSMLKQVKNLKDQGQQIEVLEKTLSDHLKEKRYLVVIDNVWKPDVWEKLKHAFPDTGNGSKIIFTTCNADLTVFDDPQSPHVMKRLSKLDSWQMFLNQAGLVEANSLSQIVKKKILQKCEDLPLNIVLLGGLFSSNKVSSYDEWLRNQVNWDASDIFSLCYNDLPVPLKVCLLYLLLFPKEFDIPVRRLLRLWLAEGFVERSHKEGTLPEDVAQGYFKDLVNRNMIQISKLRSDGSARRCRVPGVLHDNFLPKAQGIDLFHVHRNSNSDCSGPSVRRIVEYADIKSCPLGSFQLRSYLSFNIQKKDTPAREVGSFVSRIISKKGFGLLRVLDLEGVYKPSLPDKFGDLVNLRYIGLRWTFLDTLPPSIGDLPYLETLDVKHTYISSLPSSIWKLKHLRHLNLNEIRLDMPAQPPSPLPPLLTLWGLSVDCDSPVKNGLNKLLELRELGITFKVSSRKEMEGKTEEDPNPCQDLVDWIAKLTALQSLRLRSRDDVMGQPSKLSLKPLSNLTQLSHLYLLGNLQKLPAKDDFSPALKVLTLSVSKLEEDPMPTLAQLPSLTVLRLLADSYLGKKIVCPIGGFSQLRVLKLWVLKELEEWDVEEGAMCGLEALNIRGCDKLKNIPPILLQLSTFEELILTNMPDLFTKDVREKKSEHTFLTVNRH